MSVVKKRVVLALGGNALGKGLAEQMQAVHTTACAIVDLIEAGHEMVITHGNGPQVGMIHQAFEAAAHTPTHSPVLPMSVCVALSQGYIGYDLQNALREVLLKRGINKNVVSLITQVRVNPNDPAFAAPNKPIGSFLSREIADKLARQHVAVMEDAGRGVEPRHSMICSRAKARFSFSSCASTVNRCIAFPPYNDSPLASNSCAAYPRRFCAFQPLRFLIVRKLNHFESIAPIDTEARARYGTPSSVNNRSGLEVA